MFYQNYAIILSQSMAYIEYYLIFEYVFSNRT